MRTMAPMIDSVIVRWEILVSRERKRPELRLRSLTLPAHQNGLLVASGRGIAGSAFVGVAPRPASWTSARTDAWIGATPAAGRHLVVVLALLFVLVAEERAWVAGNDLVALVQAA